MTSSPFLFVLSPFRIPRRTPHPAVQRYTSPRRPFTACESSSASAPSSAPPSASANPSPAEIDKLFSRLTHVNKNLRVKASVALSEIATPATIARLVDLLSLDDTAHRRAAVQALGMTGMPAVPAVVSLMKSSENATERASCAKMLAAVALYFPEERETFPDNALDLLEKTLADGSDPVTKLATIGCLGTLGSDLNDRKGNVKSGNERAVDILIGLCGNTDDMAVEATAVSAVAQIGHNGTPERKDRVLEILRKLSAEEEEESDDGGFSYVKQIAASHLDQLEGGAGSVPDE